MQELTIGVNILNILKGSQRILYSQSYLVEVPALQAYDLWMSAPTAVNGFWVVGIMKSLTLHHPYIVRPTWYTSAAKGLKAFLLALCVSWALCSLGTGHTPTGLDHSDSGGNRTDSPKLIMAYLTAKEFRSSGGFHPRAMEGGLTPQRFTRTFSWEMSCGTSCQSRKRPQPEQYSPGEQCDDHAGSWQPGNSKSKTETSEEINSHSTAGMPTLKLPRHWRRQDTCNRSSVVILGMTIPNARWIQSLGQLRCF